MRNCLFVILAALVIASGERSAAAFLEDIAPVPLTPVEESALKRSDGKIHGLPLEFTPYNTETPLVPYRREILADRTVYMRDDPVGQILAYCLAPVGNQKAENIVLELKRGGKVLDTLQIANAFKFSALLPLASLEPGNYEIAGRFDCGGRSWTLRPAQFSVSARRREALAIPREGIPLVLQNAPVGGAQRAPIITGIPIPRHAAEKAEAFALLENGRPVPAQFTTRATWYPGREVKWLGLSFLARYENGKPAEYRVVHRSEPASSSTLAVEETADRIRVDTGAIGFEVGRKPFRGLEKVQIAGEPQAVVSGPGGPFLIDERGFYYSSALDETAEVLIEENGPVRVTILARGWLTNNSGERLTRYETRFTAWAGQPWIDVRQRTILTYNTDEKRLERLGFSLATPSAAQWSAGVDGKAFSGDIEAAAPEKEAKKNPPPRPPRTLGWLLQDRDDHCVVEKNEGRRSDGWVALHSKEGGDILLMVRHLWQLFPKEVAWGPDALVIYQWPEHGGKAFDEEEEIAPEQIHKLRYAHQGRYLDLKFPQRYYDAIKRIMPPIIEQQDINALSGNGMGLAITTDFRLEFAKSLSGQAAGEAGRLYAADLHGIADPVWNGLSEVEGRFAGKGPKALQDWERLFEEAFHGYIASVDYLGDYGMWIWPDVHNNWSPVTRRPEPHRWWVNSHYQNVWDYNFLYFRTANPDYKDWANASSRHFMDIGTVNYADPDRPLLGKLPGANYHVKGFTPWGSARGGERVGDDFVEVGGHFINPDASLFRYLLFGDPTGLELANQWFSSLGRVALPPERSRETCTTLGELLSYYENTWQPQAIAYIHELADGMLSRPFKEVPAFPVHPFFHDRWVMRYWNLTSDPRLQARVLEALEALRDGGYGELNALAWKWTGDKSWLEAALPSARPPFEALYRNPEDPLDGFGGRIFKPGRSLNQTMPHYLQALLDAGIHLPEGSRSGRSIEKAREIGKNGKPSVWLPLPKNYFGPMSARITLSGTPKITLTVQSVSNPRSWENRVAAGNVLITDAKGNRIGDASVLAGSLRPVQTLELDGTRHPGPWTLTVSGQVLLSWDGNAEGLVLDPLQ